MVREGAGSWIAVSVIYDVFLNFRGPDTRIGFADILYEFMKNYGIHIFRDNEELRPGEKISEILQAIENSKIYIPIFSKNYAASKWCLLELTHMVQCAGQSTGKLILPIFYDVNPLDVKLKTDLFKSDLTKHEGELGCAAVKPWKQALTTVAEIKGWSLKDQCKGKPLQDIIETVLRYTTRRSRDLPANLVGIDDYIEDIKKLLICCDTSDVRFIIIHGIGGVGKTVLAKAVFNKVYPQFNGCCFLLNIRESSPCCGIVKMQRKLAKDLIGYSIPESDDFEEGNNVIRGILPCCKRVLVVFDGLDGNDQFMSLVKLCTSCCPGSRIIVTTRDKSPFSEIKEEGLEENISTMSTKYFLYKMKEICFDHALPLSNKHAFKTNVVQCDLSREAVAHAEGLPLVVEKNSLLSTPRKETWKSTCKKLKKVPLEKVQQKLKISCGELGYEAQQIFPMNLMNVRFFELDGGNFVDNSEDITSELRWLCWHNCPLIANKFVLDRLVALKLSGDFIANWSGWIKIMVASKLKVLKFARSGCLIKTPHFPKLVSLERLVLKDFPRLAEIDCSINQLEGLTHLGIKWCPSLKELPESIGCLTKLRELALIHSGKVQYLPYSIGNLRFLSTLAMEGTGIVELPDTIKGLVGLQYLSLAYCSSLNSLPDAIGELRSLTELDLSGTSIKELPRSLCNLKDLKLGLKQSSIKVRGMEDWLHLEDIEDCWFSGRRSD